MKRESIKLMLAAMVLVLASATMSAQDLPVSRKGDVKTADGGRRYVVPSTTVTVDLTIRKEVVRMGPYARFAQRYFGSIAPLTDKDIYSVTAARISWTDNSGVGDTAPFAPSPTVDASTAELPKVLADRVSPSTRPLEEAAREAANMVYDIRKRRLEIVTGEYSETIFGEGLRAALETLDRTEQEYLELFYGRSAVSYHNVRHTVTPVADENVYVVCRWSESAGILPASDLTGQPLFLELKPQGAARKAYPLQSGKPAKGAVVETYVIADNVDCRILEGRRELTARTIPIYQYGITRELY